MTSLLRERADGGSARLPATHDRPAFAVADRVVRLDAGRLVPLAARARPRYPFAMLDHEDRPWGSFDVLVDDADHKVKTIAVHPGHRLSYQRHGRRSEHWFVVRGEGVVTLDGVKVEVAAGSAIDVPAGVAHRIECTGEGRLVFVEVQHGEYFGEDDIVRLEDDFGRS